MKDAEKQIEENLRAAGVLEYEKIDLQAYEKQADKLVKQLKKNQKVIRMVAIKQYKNFLAKPEGKLRLGLVTHTTSKKKRK